jgi:hypothetical protein
LDDVLGSCSAPKLIKAVQQVFFLQSNPCRMHRSNNVIYASCVTAIDWSFQLLQLLEAGAVKRLQLMYWSSAATMLALFLSVMYFSLRSRDKDSSPKGLTCQNDCPLYVGEAELSAGLGQTDTRALSLAELPVAQPITEKMQN